MLKWHISIGVFVVYIDTGSSVPGVPSKSRALVNENNKILKEWKRFETTVLYCLMCPGFHDLSMLTFIFLRGRAETNFSYVMVNLF